MTSTENEALPIPHKRLRMTLEVEAHDLGDLTRRLEQILLDIERGGSEVRNVVSSGGWSLVLSVTNPEQTEARYAEQLRAWSAAWRAARRSS
jgi:hypothetical protein